MMDLMRFILLNKKRETGPPPEPKPWEVWEENMVKEVLSVNATASFDYQLIERLSGESAETLEVTATANFDFLPVP